MHNRSLAADDLGINATYLPDKDEAAFVDVVHTHRNFVGVSREHDARALSFVHNGDTIPVIVREGFIGHRGDVIHPNPLTSHLLGTGTWGVNQPFQKLKRLFSHPLIN